MTRRLYLIALPLFAGCTWAWYWGIKTLIHWMKG
jgi:hypothetical protein